MEVKMLKSTSFMGVKDEGAVYDVPNEVGMRWCSRGIAEQVVIVLPQDEPEAQEGIETHSTYENATAKELYDMCILAELQVEARKARKYYIGVLEANKEVAEEEAEAEVEDDK